ncbi:MAG: AAA family ATPase [Myxococcota bacterium]
MKIIRVMVEIRPNTGMKYDHVSSAPRACAAAALTDTPVVVVTGPRQAGKSTLARGLVDDGTLGQYVTLDDLSAFSAAKSNPAGFLAGLGESAVIDEVQRAPELLLPRKAVPLSALWA